LVVALNKCDERLLLDAACCGVCHPGLTKGTCQHRLTSVSKMAELSKAVDSRDPEVGLAAVASLHTLVGELEAVHVANARRCGWSWQAIAELLGVTRQSVHKKHRDLGRSGRR
jgi:hypothetical protein